MKPASLSSRVIASAFWRVSKIGFDNVLRFITFIVLARFLKPADFGAFAVASIFIGLSNTLASAGMGDVLVREENPDEELKNTIFWTNITLGVVFGAILIAFSPIIGTITHNSTTPTVLSVLAFSLMVGPLASVNSAMAFREFNVRNIELIGASASVTNSAVSILVAISGGGLWALVAGNLTSSIVGLALTKWIFPWSPRFQFSYRRLTSIASFSGNILAAQIMQTLIMRLQELIATTFLTLTAVGLYRIGSRFMEMLSEAFVAPVSGLALVSLSKIRQDPARMAAGYLKMVTVTSMVYTPCILGFASIANEAVPFIFGKQWTPSIPVVQVLSLLAPATVLAYFHGPTLSSVGRSDILKRITALQFFGTLAFSLIGVRFGIIGLAISFVARSYITLPIQMLWLKRATSVEPLEALGYAARPFLAAATMAVLIYWIQPKLDSLTMVIPLKLAISCASGAAIYLLIMTTIFRSSTFENLRSFNSLVKIPKFG